MEGQVVRMNECRQAPLTSWRGQREGPVKTVNKRKLTRALTFWRVGMEGQVRIPKGRGTGRGTYELESVEEVTSWDNEREQVRTLTNWKPKREGEVRRGKRASKQGALTDWEAEGPS